MKIGDLFYLRGYLYVVKHLKNGNIRAMIVRDESGVAEYIGNANIGKVRSIDPLDTYIIPFCALAKSECPRKQKCEAALMR